MKLAIALALTAACSSRSPEPARTAAVSPPPPEAPATTPPAPLGESIYDLALPLHDHTGANIGLDISRGHPTLISMFYGTCKTACPAIIGYLKQLAAAHDDVRVVLVTFDPARDTPERLRELTVTYDLGARWTLAQPTATDARTLAAVLGVKYRPLPSGELAHNAVIVALDREGRPVARVEGLGDPTPLVANLR